MKDCWLFGELGEFGELVTTLTEEANCCGNRSEKKIEAFEFIKLFITFLRVIFLNTVFSKIKTIQKFFFINPNICKASTG